MFVFTNPFVSLPLFCLSLSPSSLCCNTLNVIVHRFYYTDGFARMCNDGIGWWWNNAVISW